MASFGPWENKHFVNNNLEMCLQALMAPLGFEPTLSPFVCLHFKEGGEFGDGVHKGSKNKHTDQKSSVRSHGFLNMNTP